MDLTVDTAANKQSPALMERIREWFSGLKKPKSGSQNPVEAVAEQAAADVPCPPAESVKSRLVRYGYRTAQIVGTAAFFSFMIGPFDTYFTTLVKEDVLGTTYKEARDRSTAVTRSPDFKTLKEKSAELKIWSDKAGKQHLALKPGGKLEDVHALMHASILLDSGIEDFNKGAADENFTAYKLKKAASDFPTAAFMKEKTTLESAKWKWIAAASLLIIVWFSLYAVCADRAKYVEKRTSSLGSFIGGIVGGLIAAPLVTGLYVNYAIGNLIG